jgi:hypothetical protein
MDLQQKIKDLERKLSLKQAFQNVTVSFPKNLKIPNDVKEEVIAKIKELASALAEGQEQETSSSISTSVFSETEITALKGLADAVLSKASNPKASSQTIPVIKAPDITAPPLPKGEFATILITDNIERTLRSRISSEETVEVVKKDNEYAIAMTSKGIRFRIPLEDLEFN